MMCMFRVETTETKRRVKHSRKRVGLSFVILSP